VEILRPNLLRPILLKCMHPKMRQLRDVLTNAIRGMTTEDLTRHPEGKWCTAEILEHLNLTYAGTIKNLERCLAAGTLGSKADRRKMRWQRLIVTRLGYFPRGRKSPERVLPRGTQPQRVIDEIMKNIDRMDDVIRECETRFSLRRPIADHPVLGPLTADEWRGFHITHGKHHARQILRLREKT
jgi:DinB family protein